MRENEIELASILGSFRKYYYETLQKHGSYQIVKACAHSCQGMCQFDQSLYGLQQTCKNSSQHCWSTRASIKPEILFLKRHLCIVCSGGINWKVFGKGEKMNLPSIVAFLEDIHNIAL